MRVAILFPGQGSQYVGMADPWLEHPASKGTLERASERLGWDVVERSRDADALKRTEVVQPAVFACDMAAFAVLEAEGLSFHVGAGHSLGEFAALVASGALEFEAGLDALAVRAAAMGKASAEKPGAMTAVLGASREEVEEMCRVAGRGDVLAVANENAPKQTVLSGTLAAVERAEGLARSSGARAIRLQVAGAFHSPLMEPALQPVRAALARLQFRAPAFPVVPNASGKPTSQPIALRDLLSRHVVSPVRWDATIRSMSDMRIDWYVEAGPGDVLSKLARRGDPGATTRSVGSPEEARSAAQEVRVGSDRGEAEEESR